MNNKLEEAARIIHTNILYGDSANYKEIKRAVQLIYEAAKEDMREEVSTHESTQLRHP